MKKSWLSALRILFILFIWWGALSLFSTWVVSRYGVTPSFPYYNLLTSQGTREEAVWAHFDGAHYLKLAESGYVDQGTQAFFPVYPLLVRGLHHATGLSYLTSGILISFASLYLALLLIQKIFGKRAWVITLFLLLFPTSFFLSSVYTESVFLSLTLLFFLLLGKKEFFWASAIAGVASGTRLAGGLLVISLLISILPRLKVQKRYFLLLPLALSGLMGYMYFLFIRFDDPLAFVHVQSMFGAGRSGGEIVLLPQVLWRYFQIFLTSDIFSWVTQRAILEFGFFALSVIIFLQRLSSLTPEIWTYLALSLVLPTLSGTLSSFPRYALVLIPWLVPENLKPKNLILVALISVTLLALFLQLFALGQFVS